MCDDALAVRGAHATAIETRAPRAGWAEQDPRAWEAALAPAIAGALAAAGAGADDVRALAICRPARRLRRGRRGVRAAARRADLAGPPRRRARARDRPRDDRAGRRPEPHGAEGGVAARGRRARGALPPAGELPRRAADRGARARSGARVDDDALRPRARRVVAGARRRVRARARAAAGDRARDRGRRRAARRRRARDRPPRRHAGRGRHRRRLRDAARRRARRAGPVAVALGTAEVVGALSERPSSIARRPSRWSRPTRIRPARTSSRTRAGCPAARCAGRPACSASATTPSSIASPTRSPGDRASRSSPRSPAR